MNYDLPLILELSAEVGFPAHKVNESEIEIFVGEGAVLCFQNIGDGDSLIGFKGTPSHSHGNLDFVGQRGCYTDVHYLDVLTGLESRILLICELWQNEVLADRYLIHAVYNDEFKSMKAGEKIVVKTAQVISSKPA